MEQKQGFQIGDRVRAIHESRILPLNIEGTVERVLPVSRLCEVRFDDRSWRRVVQYADLELVTLGKGADQV
jgi:hypothetical protein